MRAMLKATVTAFLAAVAGVFAPAHAQQQPDVATLRSDGWKLYQGIEAVPQTVIDAVKAAPKKSSFAISGYQRWSSSVVRADTITINAQSLVSLEAVDAPFIAIAGKQLYIEVPTIRDDTARFVRAPDSMFGDLTGSGGGAGSPGSTQVPQETGAHGGKGGNGGKGGAGVTRVVPPVYLFFNRISISQGNPSVGGLLRFVVDGVPGGNGGRGGPGGPGGPGAKGTPGHCGSFSCDSGPGIGGNGGQGGSGGQGGDAGHGGNGGDVYIVGPKSEWQYAGFFEVNQEGAPSGTPGSAGEAGSPGQPGGGGSSCSFCGTREAGQRGAAAQPHDFGAGAAAAYGGRGTKGLDDRDNSDLF